MSKTRKFNGVPFQWVTNKKSKSDANKVANGLRESGYHTRIVKYSDGYSIFMRTTGLRRK